MAEMHRYYELRLSLEAGATLKTEERDGKIIVSWSEPYFEAFLEPAPRPSFERVVHPAKPIYPPPTIEGGVIRGLTLVPDIRTTYPAHTNSSPFLTGVWSIENGHDDGDPGDAQKPDPFGDRPEGPGWAFSSLLGWHRTADNEPGDVNG